MASRTISACYRIVDRRTSQVTWYPLVLRYVIGLGVVDTRKESDLEQLVVASTTVSRATHAGAWPGGGLHQKLLSVGSRIPSMPRPLPAS